MRYTLHLLHLILTLTNSTNEVESDCSFRHDTVKKQVTKCEGTVKGNVFICGNPIISYGSVDGGIPNVQYSNNYSKWCQEMGFTEFVFPVQTRRQTISKPNGWVYGCAGIDDSNWHWCDSENGDWLKESLDRQGTNVRVTQVKCNLKNNEVPACISAPSYVRSKNCMIGSKVQRSDKWNWGGVDLNNGNPGYGYISECVADGWAEIEWDNGKKGLYHIGFNNIFDLYSSEECNRQLVPSSCESSSQYRNDYNCHKAIDGDEDTSWIMNSDKDWNPWFKILLNEPYIIKGLQFRSVGRNIQNMFKDISIHFSDETTISRQLNRNALNNFVTKNTSASSYVKIDLHNGHVNGFINNGFSDIKVYGCHPADMLETPTVTVRTASPTRTHNNATSDTHTSSAHPSKGEESKVPTVWMISVAMGCGLIAILAVVIVVCVKKQQDRLRNNSEEYDEDPTYDSAKFPANKKSNRNARNSPVHPADGNSQFVEVVENPYYGMEELGENENTVTVKKVENPYYNEAK